MAKIPKNLSDKDMFKGWKDEPTVEETMLRASEKESPSSVPKPGRTSEKREATYQTYLPRDAVDTLERLLLEIKVDLYKQGISDYRIQVRREGTTILLEHMASDGKSVKK